MPGFLDPFLDPKKRQEATILVAGLCLHGLLANSMPYETHVEAVQQAFDFAKEFLRQAEALKP